MKIMVQDRDAVIDVTKADIYTDDDGVYEYVVVVKNGQKFILGGYVEQGKAAKELENIFQYIRNKKDTYVMSRE